MPSIEKVVKGSTPSLLQAGKANELIRAINGLANVKPRAPIKAKVFSDWSSFEIDLDIEFLITKLKEANLGGIPEGFEEMTVVMCVNGQPENRIIYVKTPEEEE